MRAASGEMRSVNVRMDSSSESSESSERKNDRLNTSSIQGQMLGRDMCAPKGVDFANEACGGAVRRRAGEKGEKKGRERMKE